MANEGNESSLLFYIIAAGILCWMMIQQWRSTRAGAEDAQNVTSPRTENHNAMLDALKKSPKFKRK